MKESMFVLHVSEPIVVFSERNNIKTFNSWANKYGSFSHVPKKWSDRCENAIEMECTLCKMYKKNSREMVPSLQYQYLHLCRCMNHGQQCCNLIYFAYLFIANWSHFIFCRLKSFAINGHFIILFPSHYHEHYFSAYSDQFGCLDTEISICEF